MTPTIYRRRVMSPKDADALLRLVVPEQHGETLHDSCIVVDPALGEPVIANLPLPAASVDRLTEALFAAVAYTPVWTGSGRVAGLRNRAMIFGMTPRRPTYQRDTCRVSKLAKERPDIHAVLADLAVEMGQMLENVSPDIAARDRVTIAEIEDEWRMAPGAAWTSGVVNKTSLLPYHRDAMNFDAWSVMPVIRSGVSGGGLHIPEYGLTVSCRNGYVVAFNGHRLVHGVTPMTGIRKHPPGYRYSVVYYALRGMKDCATFAAELGQGQAKRSERETRQGEFVSGKRPDWR